MESNPNRNNGIIKLSVSIIGFAVFIFGFIIQARNIQIVYMLPTILGFSLLFLFSALIDLSGNKMWQSVKMGTNIFAFIGLAITMGFLFNHFFPTIASIRSIWGFFIFLICFTGLLCAASIKTIINMYKSLM